MKINYFTTHFFFLCCGVEFVKDLVAVLLEPTAPASFWQLLKYT